SDYGRMRAAGQIASLSTGSTRAFHPCPIIRPLRHGWLAVNRKLGASRLRLFELHPEKFGDNLLRPRSVGDWVRALRRNRSRSEGSKRLFQRFRTTRL